jgi:NAD(P)-dependent dehydrogenase (short-subunit alcohol dehydrogenase family)
MPQSSKRLSGQVAIITGASRRLGRAISLTLAEEGANIVAHYHTSKVDADQLCQEIETRGAQARSIYADLSNDGDVQQLVDRALQLFGRLDVLVCNAARFTRTPFESVELADWDDLIRVNLRSTFELTRRAGAHMREQGTGCIVCIGDWAGIRPYRNYLPYCVSKAGVIALAKCLALELAPLVRVNCVCPGPVLLPDDFDDAQRESVKAAVPLKRIGQPEDVAEAVRFLVAGTTFATGSTLVIDGGRLIAESHAGGI